MNGKREKLTLGKYPALTLKNARAKRDQAAHAAAMGTSPAGQKQQLAKVAAADATTVAEFGERYFREVVDKDRQDTTIPRRYFDKSIVPAIGDKPVRDVSTEDVRAITGERRKRAIESNIRRQFKLGLHLILLTMVRKSELLLARWEHVDMDAAEWHIPAENSKTDKPHIVFLSRQAVDLFKELQALAGGSALVMPGRGSLTTPFAHNAINTALKTALAGQPIPAFTIHDLRRTASTLPHANGWPSDVVERVLNHTIGGARGVYNRAEYAPQRREMLQFWADYIEQLLSTGWSSWAASSWRPDATPARLHFTRA